MNIHLNFVALHAGHLPEEGKDELELRDGASIMEALEALGLDENNPYMTLVNDTSVPVSERAQTCLKDGDTLTLFSPIKGG
jgi:thiamine biosynthesis protein ThiS